MKINWGNGIAFSYIAFVVFIAFMVYSAFGEKYDLVTSDYYDQEIKYQDKIDSKTRALELDGNLEVALNKDKLLVKFPQKAINLSGTIECFRPSDQSKDFSFSFSDIQNEISLAKEKFTKGKYLLKITWTSQTNGGNPSEEYYVEQSIFIP